MARDPSGTSSIGKYASLAVLLPVSTMVGYAMGYGLDVFFHTTWLRYVFLALGTLGGFLDLLHELDKDSKLGMPGESGQKKDTK